MNEKVGKENSGNHRESGDEYSSDEEENNRSFDVFNGQGSNFFMENVGRLTLGIIT